MLACCTNRLRGALCGLAAVVALACGTSLAAEAQSGEHENWPGWRGPRSDGSSREQNVPLHWDGATGKNIEWKVEIPGIGHASPVVWEDRIFLASCREDQQQRILLCLDRGTGKLLWEEIVLVAPLEKKHRLNSHASSTPATDGELVYCSFLDRDDMVVSAYDFAGQRQWQVRPGKFASVHGFCSPPLLFKNLVILNGDHDGDGYLVALNRQTGQTVWKEPRPNNTRSYCPPIIREAAGRTQMVLSGSKCVASYDPHTGKQHWIHDGPTEQYVASLVYNGKYFFMTAGFPEFHIMALRADGTGNVTDSAVVWHTTRGCSYVPSPILSADGRYFLIVSDEGIGSCFDAETGKRHWMKRIGKHYSGSAVEAEGLVYFIADDGIMTVVRPGEQYDVAAENPLGEETYASPAISHGRMYLRGAKHLFSIGPGRGNLSDTSQPD